MPDSILKAKQSSTFPIHLYLAMYSIASVIIRYHPLKASKEPIHHLLIKVKVATVGECRVEENRCCMNGSMEHSRPPVVNQTPYHHLFVVPKDTFSLIESTNRFFGLIHGLVQLAHYGLITINQSQNLYQRFSN